MSWRVFVGQWNCGAPEWAHVDETYDSYQVANGVLASQLAEFSTDDCDDCRNQGAHEFARLCDTPIDGEFVGFVDGDDYLLIRADRTSTACLKGA